MRNQLGFTTITAVVAIFCATNISPAGRGQQSPQGAIQTAAASPTISITRASERVIVTFSGVLESAPTARGPWSGVAGATSPWLQQITGIQQFYRASEPNNSGIFSASTVVALTLTGPFQTNFDLALAGTPDGIIPPKRQKPYFDGTLQLAGLSLPVSLRVRGNSSLQECPFPKLKLKVSKKDRAGTPFSEARELKVGTHCAEGGRGTIGRLREEKAAYREALAYEVMELLGLTTPKLRRAQIEYHDTTPMNERSPTGWQVSRKATLFEGIEVLAERLGGRALDDQELAALTEAHFDPQLMTDLLLLHVLLGNWDYALSLDGQGLWNTDVISFPDGRFVPVAGDFDLASWVTETVRLSVPREDHPDLGDVERQAIYSVDQVRQRVGDKSFNAGKERFLARRTLLEAQTNRAEIDPAGRTNALRHIMAFYNALAATKP